MKITDMPIFKITAISALAVVIFFTAFFIISKKSGPGAAWDHFKLVYAYYEKHLKPSDSEYKADIVDYDKKFYFKNGYQELQLKDGRTVCFTGCDNDNDYRIGIVENNLYKELLSTPCHGTESVEIMPPLDTDGNPYILLNFWPMRGVYAYWYILDVNRKKFIFTHSALSPDLTKPAQSYKTVVTGEYMNGMKIITINDEKTGREIYRFFWKPEEQGYDWQ